MPSSLARWALPWVLVALTVPIGLGALYATDSVACNDVPSAFSHGVHTEQSETLEVVASHCEVTHRSDGTTIETTIVNWVGLAFAGALWIGAWLLGAGVSGVVDWRTGFRGAGMAALVGFGALVVLFS